MHRRLLLLGGGGASYPIPAVVTLVGSGVGGYTMIPDSKATSASGKTWVGWITAAGGIVIGEYDHASGAMAQTTLAPPAEWLNADTHGSPSIVVRSSDSKLVVAASRHDGASPYIWISDNALSAASFPGALTPDASIGASDYTYMSTFELSDGIYMFYRDIQSGFSRLGYTKSTDGGATWASRVVPYTGASAGLTPYWRMWQNGADRVDIFATDRDWYSQANPSKVGHMYFQGGSFFKTDGTEITAAQPFGFSELTLVRDNTDGMVWCTGVGVESGGVPYALLMRGVSSTDNALETARWRTGAWQIDEVATHGGIYAGDRYGPGGAIHHANPDLVYGGKLTSGKYELHRYTSADDGSTWSAEQLTSGSADDNLWPEVPDDPSGLACVFLRGTFLSSTDTTGNTLALMGLTA